MKPIGLCAELRNPNLPDAYTEEQIKKDSGCMVTYVKLTSLKIFRYYATLATIGVCHLSKKEHICISGAESSDDALIWSRSEANLSGMPTTVSQV